MNNTTRTNAAIQNSYNYLNIILLFNYSNDLFKTNSIDLLTTLTYRVRITNKTTISNISSKVNNSRNRNEIIFLSKVSAP
jgi:hypothetical protein